MKSNFVESLFSLKGKICVVTGASKGIGFGIAQAFFEAGANVYGVGRSLNAINSPKWNYISCDITRHDEIKSILSDIYLNEKKINILVNGAGITMPNDFSIDNFRETLETNLISAYSCCNGVIPFMKKTGGGSIINITSIGALNGFPNNPSYCSSKAGLNSLTKSLAVDYGKYNIRANNLLPGYIKTDMTKKSYSDPKLNKKRLDKMIINRWGEINDLFGAAIFLGSDSSAYVTGVDLIVDGGWTTKGL
jgi:NAD(P)-dependent dehydrogenase (short-subunit alcohol dehydrogenase family)